jgi:hypothetical protein
MSRLSDRTDARPNFYSNIYLRDPANVRLSTQLQPRCYPAVAKMIRLITLLFRLLGRGEAKPDLLQYREQPDHRQSDADSLHLFPACQDEGETGSESTLRTLDEGYSAVFLFR